MSINPSNPSLLTVNRRVSKAGYVDIKLGDDLLARTGFKQGTKVGVSLKFLEDKNGRVMPELTLHADENGNSVVLKRGKPTLPIEEYVAELFRGAVIYSAELVTGKARIRRLVSYNDNFEPVMAKENCKPVVCQEEFRIVPDFLKSVTIAPGAAARFNRLASNNNGKRTTSAGDECYTPVFLVDLVLEALGVDEFDIDVCSMHSSGKFGGQSSQKPQWGSTPPSLRCPRKVVGSVPAKSRFTNDLPFGSLGRAWRGDSIWCNPPYSRRLWATWAEYAQHQVDQGNSGIVVLLAPMDNGGRHIDHIHSEDAFPITLSRGVPFFKKEKRGKDGKVLARNYIETIKGNQFIVYGKRKKAIPFLDKLLDLLLKLEYIEPNQHKKYREWLRL
ncbi:hypothetical protein [Tepidicaulis sp.]|uniref:hypothetical protein n=1 Tax=Tepidicaulis sp. TaxID=1920809 RepID=UPI003B59E0EB